MGWRYGANSLVIWLRYCSCRLSTSPVFTPNSEITWGRSHSSLWRQKGFIQVALPSTCKQTFLCKIRVPIYHLDSFGIILLHPSASGCKEKLPFEGRNLELSPPHGVGTSATTSWILFIYTPRPASVHQHLPQLSRVLGTTINAHLKSPLLHLLVYLSDDSSTSFSENRIRIQLDRILSPHPAWSTVLISCLRCSQIFSTPH